jgi:hypothetical protein
MSASWYFLVLTDLLQFLNFIFFQFIMQLTGKEWRQILEVGPILTSLILFFPELLLNSLERVKAYLIGDLNLRCHMICSSSQTIKNHWLKNA